MKSDKSDKNKKAVALKYNKDDTSPFVLAKGKGYIAEKIVEKGKDEKVHIYRDENIIDNLMNLDIGEEIPPELYEVVAEIIAYVYYLDRKLGDIND